MTAWNKIDWTDEMISFIKDNFNNKTNQQLADGLNLKITSVRTKCYELGLKRMELESWNEEQTKFLKENYKSIGDTELAEIFNTKFPKNKKWTKKHIEKKRRYLNLKRTKADLVFIRNDWKEKGLYKESNRKMWAVVGVLPIGTVRIWKNGERYFKMIKTDKGYQKYARWLWEKHHGKIPKRYNIFFKDLNGMNVTIENLECITNEEKMYRNSIAGFPQDLRDGIWKVKKLKNRIKKAEQSKKAER